MLMAALHNVETPGGSKKISVAYLTDGDIRWLDDDGELYYAYQAWCNAKADLEHVQRLLEQGPW